MADSEVIRRILIEGRTRGVSEVVAELQKLAGAHEGASVASEKQTKASLSVERQLEKERRALDENYRALKQFEQTHETVTRARQQGLVSQAEETLRLEQAVVRFNNYGQAATGAGRQSAQFTQQAGLARHELVNLSRQAQDLAVSLGSGQSFGTVLLQQGTQIADVFANSQGTVRGFFSQLVSGAASVITPLRAVVAGAVAIGVAGVSAANAYQNAQVDVQRALSGTGRAAQLTAADITAIAKQTSSVYSLSVSEAEKTASVFASTGKIARDQIAAANQQVHSLAKTLGEDSVDAAKLLAEAMTGGIDAVDKLDRRLNFLTASQREYLRSLEATLDKTKFQSELLRILGGSLGNARELTTQFGESLTVVGNLASNLTKALGEISAPSRVSTARGGIQDELANALENRGRIETIGGSSSARDIREADQAIANLRLRIGKLEADELTTKFGAIGKAAMALGRQFTQAEEKARDLEHAVTTLKQAVASTELNLTLGPTQEAQLQRAAAAAQLQASYAREAVGEEARRVQYVTQIAAQYQGMGPTTALQLSQLKDQLTVAQAVTTAAQQEAQQRATINSLLAQGKAEHEAIAIAAAQRQVAEAQATAEAQKTLHSLSGQCSLLAALGECDQTAQPLETTNERSDLPETT